MQDSSIQWFLKEKESQLYLRLDRGIDQWEHEFKLATPFPTRKALADCAKKIGLNKNEYHIV